MNDILVLMTAACSPVLSIDRALPDKTLSMINLPVGVFVSAKTHPQRKEDACPALVLGIIRVAYSSWVRSCSAWRTTLWEHQLLFILIVFAIRQRLFSRMSFNVDHSWRLISRNGRGKKNRQLSFVFAWSRIVSAENVGQHFRWHTYTQGHPVHE